MPAKPPNSRSQFEFLVLGLQIGTWMLVLGFVLLVAPRAAMRFEEFEFELPLLIQFILELSDLNMRYWAITLIASFVYGAAHFVVIRYVVPVDSRLRWRVRLLAVPVAILIGAVVLFVISYINLIRQVG